MPAAVPPITAAAATPMKIFAASVCMNPCPIAVPDPAAVPEPIVVPPPVIPAASFPAAMPVASAALFPAATPAAPAAPFPATMPAAPAVPLAAAVPKVAAPPAIRNVAIVPAMPEVTRFVVFKRRSASKKGIGFHLARSSSSDNCPIASCIFLFPDAIRLSVACSVHPTVFATCATGCFS